MNDIHFTEDENYQDMKDVWIRLGLGILCLLALSAAVFMHQQVVADQNRPKGARTAVICPTGDYQGTIRTMDIHQKKCPKCGAQLGYAWHCKKCGKIFPFVPPVIDKNAEQAKVPPDSPEKDGYLPSDRPEKCPACGSTDIEPLAPDTAKK